MRKMIVLAALVLSLPAMAQVKEGFVKYKTTLSGADEMTALLGGQQRMSIYFKNERSLTEMATAALYRPHANRQQRNIDADGWHQ
jgi:hypothetical protein